VRSSFELTGIERTLIDLTVRPDYAGGPAQVLEAFRRARSRTSVSHLLQTLDGLSYVYPYHQAVGFYMQRAGYDADALSALRAKGLTFDFYVGYGTSPREFDADWRVHFPTGLIAL
jgi:hypothetical protein